MPCANNTMEAHRDFKELFECLNANGVKYIVVGGYALAFHGAPRFTGDMDVLIKPDGNNAKRLIAALRDFGVTRSGISEADFKKPAMVIQIGVPPVRVDILTSLTGVTWQQVCRGKVKGDYAGIPVLYIGRRELAANKRAVGRIKDLADLEALGEK